MKKRIVLLILYYLLTLSVSLFLSGKGHGSYAPLAVFLSWAYVLSYLTVFTFFGLAFFYLLFLGSLLFVKVALGNRNIRFGHILVPAFYLLGSLVSSFIQGPRYLEPIRSYIILCALSASGVMIYLISDWAFVKGGKNSYSTRTRKRGSGVSGGGGQVR